MKNIILVFVLLLYVMMSCSNAAMDKKTSDSDTMLRISYNVYSSSRYYSFYQQSDNELSEYLVEAKSEYDDIVEIEEMINHVVRRPPVDDNDTTMAFIGGYKQKYFKTSYEQNFTMMSNVLDSLSQRVGISDTCKIYLDLSFGGAATVEMTEEYIRRRHTLSWNIDKGCFSDIVKSSRMVSNWNSILRPYNVYVADVAVDDVEIISLKRFMKRNVGLRSAVSPSNIIISKKVCLSLRRIESV